MKWLLLNLLLGPFLAIPTVANAEPPPARDNAQEWTWQGGGGFPEIIALSILQDANGDSVVILDEWGELRSVGGWGELQRTHTLTAGTIRRIGGRAFIVLPEQRTAAEFEVTPDRVLHLRWFGLETSAPSEQELLAGSHPLYLGGRPREMKPAGAPGAAARQPLPL